MLGNNNYKNDSTDHIDNDDNNSDSNSDENIKWLEAVKRVEM